jgi:hypothetical protein
MTIHDEFRKITKDYERLKKKIEMLDSDEITCRACGSRLRRTKYSYVCINEYGPCGELVMTDEHGRDRPHSFFHRTLYEKDTMEPRPLTLQWEPFLQKYFVAGEECSREDYLDLIDAP